MMPETTDALQTALAENAPDKGTPATVSEGVDATTTATETNSQDTQPTAQSGDDGKGPATTETATNDADELTPASVREYLAAHPDQKAVIDLITGEIKSGFTPKLQEAAELRKRMEGVDPQAIDTIRQLQTMAQQDPAKVAEYFRQQAEEFEKIVAAGNATPQDPLSDLVPVTDTETQLLTEIQQLKQWKIQQEKITQQTALNQEAQRVHRTLDAIEKKYGVEIPESQRLEAWQMSRQAGMPVDKVWLATNHETLIKHLVTKAKDEASTVVRSKQEGAAANPSPVSPRQAAADTGGKPSTFKDFLRTTRTELENTGKTF